MSINCSLNEEICKLGHEFLLITSFKPVRTGFDTNLVEELARLLQQAGPHNDWDVLDEEGP